MVLKHLTFFLYTDYDNLIFTDCSLNLWVKEINHKDWFYFLNCHLLKEFHILLSTFYFKTSLNPIHLASQ